MGQNIVMVYLAQLKIEWFFSQNIKWKKYNKKEVKWKIAKAEEHYAEKKPSIFSNSSEITWEREKRCEGGGKGWRGKTREHEADWKQNRNNCYGKTKKIKREYKINRGTFKTLNILQNRFSVKNLHVIGLFIIYKTGLFVVHLATGQTASTSLTYRMFYSVEFILISAILHQKI